MKFQINFTNATLTEEFVVAVFDKLIYFSGTKSTSLVLSKYPVFTFFYRK